MGREDKLRDIGNKARTDANSNSYRPPNNGPGFLDDLLYSKALVEERKREKRVYDDNFRKGRKKKSLF